MGWFALRVAVGPSLMALAACQASPSPPAAAPPQASARTPAPTRAATTISAQADGDGADATSETSAAATKLEAPRPAVPFLADDFETAVRQARTEDKLLFVDAWAEWCHTCKSMKAFVFTEPALIPLSERVLFVELDTDKPENADFLANFEVNVWPSLFAIDPGSRTLLGYWPGSATLAELRSFLQEALDAREALIERRLDPKSPRAQLIQAKTQQTRGQPRRAAELYAEALSKAPPDWSQRDEALHGRIWALAQSRQIDECIRFGGEHLDEIEGSSLPAFFASILEGCLERDKDPVRRAKLQTRLIARLQELVRLPPSSMSADDRADTWSILSGVLHAARRGAEARQAQVERLRVLEAAAQAANSPAAAATFDAARADAYLVLGRPDDAVSLLQQRTKELPDSYEPPARLASVLERLDRREAALEALDVALSHAYGPRRLGYLAQRARLLGSLGRTHEQIETLESEVAGYESLRGGQANARRLNDARTRLAAARRGAAP